MENYLHFMKNCKRPHYEKLKPLKSGFIENSNFENNRDPCFSLNQNFALLSSLINQILTFCPQADWMCLLANTREGNRKSLQISFLLDSSDIFPQPTATSLLSACRWTPLASTSPKGSTRWA